MSILARSDEVRVGPPAIALGGSSAYSDGKVNTIDPGVAAMIRKAASDAAKKFVLHESKSEQAKPSTLSGSAFRRWSPPSNPFSYT
jgi:hypothetical protein